MTRRICRCGYNESIKVRVLVVDCIQGIAVPNAPNAQVERDEMGKVPVSLSIDNLICCLDTVVSFNAFGGHAEGVVAHCTMATNSSNNNKEMLARTASELGEFNKHRRDFLALFFFPVFVFPQPAWSLWPVLFLIHCWAAGLYLI